MERREGRTGKMYKKTHAKRSRKNVSVWFGTVVIDVVIIPTPEIFSFLSFLSFPFNKIKTGTE